MGPVALYADAAEIHTDYGVYLVEIILVGSLQFRPDKRKVYLEKSDAFKCLKYS